MSLLHSPTILPPPRDRIAELQRENEILKIEIRELKISLQRERERSGAVETGVANLRSALTPLYRGLQQIFGDIEAMDIPESGQPEAAPRNKAVWNSWKDKLDPQCGKAIDALLVHGAMTQTQLRIHVGCAAGSIYGVVCRLNKAGIINKNGGKISLKEL